MELIDHIFDYVPEYGYRVEKELHDLSLFSRRISPYCDLLRYCARLHKSPFNACVTILITDNVYEDVKEAALRYLEKNRIEFLREYLKNVGWIPGSIIEKLGFVNVKHWTKLGIYYDDIYCDDGDHSNMIYKDISYYDKVVGIYTLMVLRENGFMNKKEFDAECSLNTGIDTILEIILAVYPYFHHIFNVTVRYFRDRMPTIMERIKRKQSVVDHIVIDDSYNCDHVSDIQKRLDAPIIRTNDVDGILHKIRNQLMSGFRYDHCWDSDIKIDHYSLFSMIESLADEE